MRKPMIAVLLAAVLALSSAAASAQGVYKYTDKDGRVIYTDDPKAGGGTAQPVEDVSSSVAPPAGASTASRKLLDQADKRAAALDKAMSDITAAHTALRDAEARKEAGVEPIEGERQGRRFRPEYWQRQQALQRDIDTARAQLNDALERRNALR